MTLQMRRTSWVVSGLLLMILVSAGSELVKAQPRAAGTTPEIEASEATFVSLGDQKIINTSNIAYTIDDGKVFDVYFACSSNRGEDPLRLTDMNEIAQARSSLGDEKQHGKSFEKYDKYFINKKYISYIEFKGDSVLIFMNLRISDAFVQLKLSGADAERFRKKRREF